MSPVGAETWITTAKYELFEGWSRWLSFALIWIWSCVVGILSQEPYILATLPTLLSFGNSIVLLFCVIALVIVLALSRRIQTACGSKRYVAIGALFLATGSIGLFLSAFFQVAIVFFIGAALGGASIGILKVAWGEMYSRMPLRASMLSMGYALICSSVVVLLIHSAGTVILGMVALVVSLPLGFCLFMGAQQLSSGAASVSTGKLARLPLWMIFAPAIVGLSFGVVKASASFAPGQGLLFLDISEASFCANLLAGILFMTLVRYLGTRITPAHILVTDMVIIVAGLLLLATPRVSTSLAIFVHELGFSLFYFFMIVYWGDLARRLNLAVIPTYTVGYLTMMACQFVGAIFCMATGQQFALSGDMTLLYILVLAFLLVTILMLGISSGSQPRRKSASVMKGIAPDSTSAACERIADEYALTPREREVLDILARGRTASYIAEELVISQDTAKSHIKNIYRKIDVHTQQELLTLIETAVST